MNLSGYLAVARRWWWTLLVAAWVAGVGGYFIASQLPPTYEARVRLLVGPLNDDVNILRASGLLVQTYGELATSDPVLNATVEKLGLAENGTSLRTTVRTTVNDSTRLLTIRVENQDPKLAAAIANELSNQLEALDNSTTARPEGLITPIEPAVAPTEAVSPNVSLIVILAAAAGLMGALGLILIIDYLDPRVRDEAHARQLLGSKPILVSEGRTRSTANAGHNGQSAVDKMPASRGPANFRLLAARLASAGLGSSFHNVLIVGSEMNSKAGEVALNLGMALADDGRRVVLVDANHQDRALTTLLRVDQRFGITDLLKPNPRPLADVMTERAGMTVIPPGATPRNVDPDTIAPVLTLLRRAADVVVITGPPVPIGPSSLAWVRAAEATALVVWLNHTKPEDLSEAAESIDLVGGRLIGGILLNHRASRRGSPRALSSRAADKKAELRTR